jgi:hypothetical protein
MELLSYKFSTLGVDCLYHYQSPRFFTLKLSQKFFPKNMNFTTTVTTSATPVLETSS